MVLGDDPQSTSSRFRDLPTHFRIASGSWPPAPSSEHAPVAQLDRAPYPPEKADTTIPQGVPCTRLANLILAPKQERQRIAAYIPRWGIQLAAHLSERTAWALYRDRLKRFGSLIGDREPIVLHKEMSGMGRAKRCIITIADDDRAPFDKLCRKLIAADATFDVLRNPVRTDQ